MNKGKAATALAIAVALLAMGALAVLPLPERNPYEVHEVPTAEEDATMEAQETGGGIDWDALPASVVAWVRVPGTTVDYPIVQGRTESPDFYLTHDAGGARRLPRGQIVPVRGRPGRAFGRRAGLGLRDVQLPDEQLAHRRLREGGGRMGFAPFGIGLLMGLLTLTAYACCAAGDDDRD